MDQNKLVVVDKHYIETLFGKCNNFRKLNDQYVGTYFGDSKVEMDITGRIATVILTNVDSKYLSEYVPPESLFYTYEQLSKVFQSTKNLNLFYIKNEHLTIGSEYDLREKTEELCKMITNYTGSIEIEIFNVPFTEKLKDKYKVSIYDNNDLFNNSAAYVFHVDYAVQLKDNEIICFKYIDESWNIGFVMNFKELSKCIATIEKEL